MIFPRTKFLNRQSCRPTKAISMKPRLWEHIVFGFALCLLAWGAGSAFADVSRAIQERYRGNYVNKALFLKIPVFSERQYVQISGQSFRHDPALARTPRYKVGDQLRVLGIDFGGEEIKFKLGEIAGAGTVELVFRFDTQLQENFPNSGVFDAALAATFTEGLKYTEIEDAKRTYVEQEFDRAARDIAGTAGTNRDAVLKYVAPKLPAYQEAMQDIEALQNRNQELGKQISQAQAENKKLEAESKSQQAEISKLRGQVAGLQEKIESSSSQLTRLGDDLRSARGVSQNYQRELNNLQRSLRIRIDPNRDLAAQIAEVGQGMMKIQKESEDLQAANGSLRSNLQKAQGDNARLTGENQDLKTSVRQKDDTIRALTSKEDSLARQYFLLRQQKDNLENIVLSVASLNTRVMDETSDNGVFSRTVNVYLGNVPLGSFEWRFPGHLSADQGGTGEAVFSRDSIDYVKVTPAERRILQSLGERWKLRVNLDSRSESLQIQPDKPEAIQEISERDSGSWRWRLLNRGGEDSRIILSAQLVNKNGDDLPLFRTEQLLESSNLVRQARGYLQPVPLVLGVVLGCLLMGIAGLFRRSRHPGYDKGGAPPQPPAYGGRKQL